MHACRTAVTGDDNHSMLNLVFTSSTLVVGLSCAKTAFALRLALLHCLVQLVLLSECQC